MTPTELAARIDWGWLHDRCTEDGDCLRWDQGVNQSGQPKYSFKIKGEQYSRQMRQIVWALAGMAAPRGTQCISMTCGNQSCLNHEHMTMTTKGAVVRKMCETPSVKAKKFVAGVNARRPGAKLTMEQARYIRECDKTLTALSEELGVSVAWVSRVRRGEAFREMRASPFAGLGA